MPDARSSAAVLLMAHGTPESVDQMPEYLRLVRGGREPSTALIEEMVHNWKAIGGHSPLTDITVQQGRALQQAALIGSASMFQLSSACGTGVRSSPTRFARSRRSAHAGLSASPSPHSFQRSASRNTWTRRSAALPAGTDFTCVRSFHDHPLLIEAFAEKVRAEKPGPDEDVVFTAHSIPQRVAASGDPYAREFAATAKAVAARCGISSYQIAYQSAGRTPEPWIGSGFVGCRSGTRKSRRSRRCWSSRSASCATIPKFCSTSTSRQPRRRVKLSSTLRRTQSLNTSPTFIRALAALVTQAVAD